jgi:predicted porin
MKKSLIAVAALTAITGAAQAQSSVEMYGLLDLSYSAIESSGSTTTVKQNILGQNNSGNGSGTLNGSRIGFRGTEDLGGGLKAGFVVEYGLNLTGYDAADSATTGGAGSDTSSSQTPSTIGRLRQGFVSLDKAGLGTVKIGTQYSLIDPAGGAGWAQSQVVGTNNGVGAHALFKYSEATWARLPNGVTYVSPSFSGVKVSAQHNVSESSVNSGATSSVKKEDQTGFAIDYTFNNGVVGYAQTKVNNYNVASTSKYVDLIGSANDSTESGSAMAGQNDADLKYSVLGGMYNFGFAKVGLSQSRYDLSKNTANKSVESKQNSLQVSFPVSANLTIGVGYTDGEINGNGAKVYDTTAADILAVYALSKRTNVYAYTGNIKYDGVGSTNLKQTQTAVGLRHSF